MTFLREAPIRAIRKRRGCAGCERFVEVGQPAIQWVGINDGQFCAVIYHPDCREAEVELNKLHDHRWYDDWMNLYADMEWEDWPWLILAYPGVATRMGITYARYEEIRASQERTRLAFSQLAREQAAARVLSQRQ